MSSSRSLLSLGLPKDILASLTRNGYENLQDLVSASPETLSKDLNVTLTQAEALLERYQNPRTPQATLPMTQSAAAMAQHSQRISTKCASLDAVLEGGLSRGHILEISGPPGSPKEKLAINIVAAFAEAGEEIIFVDCQNMTSPAVLVQSLERISNGDAGVQRYIHYLSMHTLPELLLFIHQLPTILASRAKVSLLVINSISFPFQNPELGIAQKNAHLDRVKQGLSKACASRNLTVVTTSQLATKMINADGTPGTFDSGAKGIMVPQLGFTYLPIGKSYRVVLSPDGLTSGLVKLLSSPKYPPGKAPTIVEPYSITNKGMVA